MQTIDELWLCSRSWPTARPVSLKEYPSPAHVLVFQTYYSFDNNRVKQRVLISSQNLSFYSILNVTFKQQRTLKSIVGRSVSSTRYVKAKVIEAVFSKVNIYLIFFYNLHTSNDVTKWSLGAFLK